VLKGTKVPDISTKEKFIAALEGANRVLYSGGNQANGLTRTAKMMAELFKRPEFANVKSAVSPYGEGGAALARHEGDMAIQNISQILIWDNLVLVGPVPEEFGMYLDGVAAVSAKAKNAADAQRFIDYATQKGTFALWYSRGVDPRRGAN
jgi:ABC-type Fe3+ transport system substrate-binding protein